LGPQRLRKGPRQEPRPVASRHLHTHEGERLGKRRRRSCKGRDPEASTHSDQTVALPRESRAPDDGGPRRPKAVSAEAGSQ
jgi:hypothetical protein